MIVIIQARWALLNKPDGATALFQLRSTLHFREFFTVLAFFCALIVAFNVSLCAETVITTINLRPAAGNGLSPKSVDVNSVTNMIYIVNELTDNVSVIDGADNQVVDVIVVGDEPEFVAVNINTNMVYVINRANNTISIIDGSTNSVVDTVVVGEQPGAIVVNPDTNLVYITDLIEGKVYVLNGSDNQVVNTITLGDIFLSGIGINVNTNMVYITDLTEDIVHVIDGSTNSVVGNIAVESLNGGIAVNPNTNMIYITDSTEDIVRVIDGSINQVVDTVSLGGASAISVNHGTNMVYVIDSVEDNVSVIDGSTNEVVDTVAVVHEPTAIAVNPDTNTVYIANGSDDSVSVMEGRDNQVTVDILLGVRAGSIAVNSVTDKVYVVDRSGDSVFVINGSNNQVTSTITLGADAGDIAVNPDTDMVYVTTRSGVSIIDGSSNLVVDTITIEGGAQRSIAVNANTNKIYVNSDDEFEESTLFKEHLIVIDGSNNSIEDRISVRADVIDIEVNVTTNTVYVVQSLLSTSVGRRGGVSIIDGVNNEELDNLIPGDDQGGLRIFLEGIGVNINTNIIYIGNDNATSGTFMYTMDGLTNQLVDNITITTSTGSASEPDALAVNPNNDKIYVVVSSEDIVYVVDGLDNQVVDTVTVGDKPCNISVNTINNLVYVANETSGDITVIQVGDVAPQIPSSLFVVPAIAKRSLRFQDAAVTVTDQNGQPISGVIVNADTNGQTAIVKPLSMETDADGKAEFSFRFRLFAKEGEITFCADELEASIRTK